MPIVKAKIKCLATYETEIDVPNDEIKNLYEYLLEHISETEINNLEFYDDIDRNFLVEATVIETEANSKENY